MKISVGIVLTLISVQAQADVVCVTIHQITDSDGSTANYLNRSCDTSKPFSFSDFASHTEPHYTSFVKTTRVCCTPKTTP